MNIADGGTISAGNLNNLAIGADISGVPTGSSIKFTTVPNGTIAVAGSILGSISNITTDAALTLTGENAFGGTLTVNSNALTVGPGGNNVIPDAAPVVVGVAGAAQLVLQQNETIGALSGNGTITSVGGPFTLRADGVAGTPFSGTIAGTNGFTKHGNGTLQLSGNNTYAGVTLVEAGGILVASGANSLGQSGAGNETNVQTGATLSLRPVAATTFNEAISIAGSGVGSTGAPGALDNNGANSTLLGAVTLTGPATISATSGNLTLSGGVNATAGATALNFNALSGTTIVANSVIGANVGLVTKVGDGALNLSGQPNLYTGGTTINDGVVIVDADNNLGATAGAVTFGANTTGSSVAPTLQVDATTNFGNRGFNVNGPLGQIDVNGAAVTATIDADDLTFNNPPAPGLPNTLVQTGTGTLVIDATDALDDGSVDDVGQTVALGGTLDATSGTLTVQGAGLSGTTPTFGPGGVPAAGTTTLQLAGLGNANGGQPITAVINLGVAGFEFDNVLINQSAVTKFDGTLTTTGDLTVTGTGSLTLGGPVTVNNIHVVGNQMIVSNPASLGDNIASHDQRATFVWGQLSDPLIPNALATPGQLSLSGGITTAEKFTIENNGILNNLSGDNIVDSEVRLRFTGANVPAGFTGSDNAQIGSTAGTLTLKQGVFSNPGQSMTINGIATDAGTVNVAGQIQSTVANVVLGNSSNNTNTVILGANNAYSGTTTINGGNVVVGNNGAFSGSKVMVNQDATLSPLDTDAPGPPVVTNADSVTLNNEFALATNTTLSLSSAATDSLTLAGQISGEGGITNLAGTNNLSGNNTYTGATNVADGTLNITGSSTSSSLAVSGAAAVGATPAKAGILNLSGTSTATTVTVGAGGTLVTSGSDLLSDAAKVTVNAQTANLAGGILTINGNETLDSLTVGGTATVSGVLTGLGQSTTVLAGGSLTVGGLIDNHLTVDGTFESNGNVTVTKLDGTTAGATVTINNNATLTAKNGAYGGKIIGTGASLVKNGSGTLTLSGDNSGLTGKTTVNDGTLAANKLGSDVVDIKTGGILTASGEFAASNINVAQGGTLNANALIANGAIVNTSGVVNVGDNVAPVGTTTLGSLNVNAASGVVNLLGDNLTAGGLNGAGTINLGANTLTASNGTYGGAINGAGNLTKTGAGTLTLSGGNGYTGATNVNGGTLEALTSLSTSNLNVASGATYLNKGGLNNALVNISNNGTFKLFGNEEATKYDSAGGTLNGTGLLTAANYNLSNGASTAVGADLGLGTLTVNGGSPVTLNGTAAAGIVNIDSGTLVLGSADRLADNAAVTNAGTLSLNGNDTVGSYTSTGTLDGTGTLTAATYALNNGSVVNANLGEGALASNGTVALNGKSSANTVKVETGNLTIQGGSLVIDPDNSSPAVAKVDVDVLTGATLTVAGNNTISKLTNAGTIAGTKALTVNDDGDGDESTVTTTFNGGTLATNATVNANGGAVLNGGTTINGTLNGDAWTYGAVTVGGTLGVATDSLMVNNGSVLTLNGVAQQDTVGIASGGEIALGANERLSNAATVTNNGTLTLFSAAGPPVIPGEETIATYKSTGGTLNGMGTLKAKLFELNTGSTVETNQFWKTWQAAAMFALTAMLLSTESRMLISSPSRAAR